MPPWLDREKNFHLSVGNPCVEGVVVVMRPSHPEFNYIFIACKIKTRLLTMNNVQAQARY